MRRTYPCTLPNCDKVFTRAYELKKHKAAHDDPCSVFHCPRCDFITFTKRRLAIHFATHTGEKDLLCPDVTSSGANEQRCDFRTHDPSALSKHRKKVHGYIPLPNRGRPKTALTPLRKTRQQNDERVPRRRRRSQRAVLAPRRKLSHIPCKANNANSGSGRISTAALLPLENASRDTIDSDYDTSSATLVRSDNETGLDILFDPSLHPQWMAKYEMSYSEFDLAGMRHRQEPIPEDLMDSAILDERTGREGCLCPEWMVEARIQGWDESVLEAHKEYYVINA